MFGSRYAKVMFAPDDGATSGAVASEVSSENVETDNTDYKALYEKEVAERAKERASLKKTNDALASENAQYKREKRESMSEEQKRDAELAEEREHWKAVEKENNEIKVANIFAKQGYDEKDYSGLAKKLVAVCGVNAQEVADELISFVKTQVRFAGENNHRASIKDNANGMLPKASSAQAETKSDYQLYQESKKKTNNIVEL